METDTRLAGLLEEATGPAPGWGDVDDVRRRARRFTRRRRAGASAAALAVVVSGLLVARGLQPHEPADPLATEGEGVAGQPVLFGRQLAAGGQLRAMSTGVEGEVQVQWPGSEEGTVLTPRYAGDGKVTSFVQGGTFPGGIRYGEMVLSEVDGEEWALLSFMRCPDDTAPVELRAWAEGTSPDEADAMAFVDGLAMVAVPFTRPFGDGPGVPVYVELRDAAGTVLFADGPTTSDHEAEDRGAGLADPEPSGDETSEDELPGEGSSGSPSAADLPRGSVQVFGPGPVECGVQP